MPEKIRIGILGCGKAAHLHAQAIRNLKTAKLVSAWSRSTESATTFAQKYTLEAFRSITRMVKNSSVDLVIVCTPHPFHKDPVIEAAEAGAHVLVEKPLVCASGTC